MTNMPKSIFQYITTDRNGIHTILPNKFAELLADPNFNTEDLEYKLAGNQFPEDLKPILVITPEKLKKTYNPALKKAIYKYREKHREEYNEIARRSYNIKNKDEEWVKNRREKQKETNRKYRERVRAEKIKNDPNYIPRGKGRPRKVV
jgi:hypothetical protein